MSLAVWLPILISLFLVFEVVDFQVTSRQACPIGQPRQGLTALQCHPSFSLLLAAAAALIVVFFAGVILFSFLSRLQLDSAVPGTTPRRRYARMASYSLAGVALLVVIIPTLRTSGSIDPLIGVQTIFLVLLSAGPFMLASAEYFSPANRGYFLRRSFEKWSSLVLPNVVAAMFVGALPLIVANLKPLAGEALGPLGTLGGIVTLLSGIGTALYGYYLKAKDLLPGIAGQILAIAGSLLFLSGLLLFSLVLAEQIFTFTQQTDQEQDPKLYIFTVIIFVSLLLLALFTGLLGSVKATGLHRFYRDRLMETFMPAANAVKEGTARQSDVADNLSVADVVRTATERGNRPYHLVNAHAILVNDHDPKVALRGGDNFLISPAFVGSSTTGWVRTRDYVRRHGQLTLASAMAASGAAANANAGYIGTGLTRDRFVSAVMGLAQHPARTMGG